MKKLVVILVVLAVVAAGAYIGYQMHFRGKTFREATRWVEVPLPQGSTRIRAADLSYDDKDFDKALALYREALERSAAVGSTGEADKLLPDEVQYAKRRCGHCLYEIAKKANWQRGAVDEAAQAYEAYLREYPDVEKTEAESIRKRVRDIQALAR